MATSASAIAAETATVNTLNQLRQQLSLFLVSLRQLRQTFETAPFLPRNQQLSAAISVSLHQLSLLSNSIDKNRDKLASNYAYPLPSFEGLEHQGPMETLLRVRFEPAVEDWTASGSANGTKRLEGAADVGARVEELEKLWEWAQSFALEQAGDIPWDIDYTMREVEDGVEKVRTGITRALNEGSFDEDDDDDEDGSDEDEEAKAERVRRREQRERREQEKNEREEVERQRKQNEETAGKAMSLEMISRFMETGELR